MKPTTLSSSTVRPGALKSLGNFDRNGSSGIEVSGFSFNLVGKRA